MNGKFNIGDYVKLINTSEQDELLNIHKGEIGIIEFIDGKDIYINLPNRKYYIVYAEQIELYKDRCIESIILAHGITKDSLVKSMSEEIKQYIDDNFIPYRWKTIFLKKSKK